MMRAEHAVKVCLVIVVLAVTGPSKNVMEEHKMDLWIMDGADTWDMVVTG